jgi:hypothetical protein
MTLVLKRRMKVGGINHYVLQLLVLLGVLSVGTYASATVDLGRIPNVRDYSISILLDPPTPLNSVNNLADSGLSLAPASINEPVPLPEIVDAAAYGLPSEVLIPAVQASPFALPSRFDTGPSATPYVFASRNPTDALRAAICLTSAIYYEAASESDDGQRAVAQVILNRVRHGSWPNTVCGVIYQGSERAGCQFSYACDGSMARLPSRDGWTRAGRVARAALAGYVYAPVGLSTYYHTPAVNPAWNRSLITAAVIGNHIFYRMPGANGGPRAFYASYFGGEPLPGPKPRAYVPPAAMPFPMRPQTAAITPWPGSTAAPAPSYQPVPMPQSGRDAAPSVRQDSRYVAGALPDSDVMPAYRNSGAWIAR